jgi:hypothetical protein
LFEVAAQPIPGVHVGGERVGRMGSATERPRSTTGAKQGAAPGPESRRGALSCSSLRDQGERRRGTTL